MLKTLPSEVLLTLDMGSKARAKHAYRALTPEIKSPPTPRSKITLELQGRNLVLRVKASDTTALRAAVNSYCRWISLINRTYDVLENFATGC